jgi:predicted nucleotidyltransferase
MRDPLEGLTPDGLIRTGADRRRVPAAFEPLLGDLVAAFDDLGSPTAELHLYGSVATGAARPAESDVDVLVIDAPPEWAASTGGTLSQRYAELTRAVDVGAGTAADYQRDSDESYGNRVFLRHYCVPLRQPAAGHVRPIQPFPGDLRAARGFNGDIGAHLACWRAGPTTHRRVARKVLLAAAGVVSVREHTWTTDRIAAAHTWMRWEPERRQDFGRLLEWSEGRASASPAELDAALAPEGIVTHITDVFATEIGLWDALSRHGPAATGTDTGSVRKG